MEGSIVRVIYHKNHPEKIVEKSIANSMANIVFFIMAAIGLIIIIYGIVQ